MIIARDVIEDFWANNVEHGVKIEGPMLWGYFFTDEDPATLEKSIARIEELGYRFVDILEPSEDDDPSPSYHLHVERVEAHSLESLVERCRELDAVATRLGIGDFDGFDVGNVDGSALWSDDD